MEPSEADLETESKGYSQEFWIAVAVVVVVIVATWYK